MATKTLRYNLETINDIIFQGFDYSLPEKTMKIISEISLQVGAPDYVRTPVFQKRENPLKSDQSEGQKEFMKKKKGNKSMEITNDEDWNVIRASPQAFQSTKMEEKVGINVQIDIIRSYLNKLTDKNYIDMRNKITDVIDKLITENIAAEAQVIIGARINKDFQNKVRVITIMTGVKSPYVLGKAREAERGGMNSEMSDLGIEVLR
jgi:cell division GTPase FtsZ